MLLSNMQRGTKMSRTPSNSTSASTGQLRQYGMTMPAWPQPVDLSGASKLSPQQSALSRGGSASSNKQRYSTTVLRTPSNSTIASTSPQQQPGMAAEPHPIDLSGDKPIKLLRKLQKLHEEVNRRGLSSLLANRETIAVGLESSAPFPGDNFSNRRQAKGYASTATKTSRPTSEMSFETHIFSAQNGETSTETKKKSLPPDMKARKDLLRSLGKCFFDCREKKVKCWISHHAIEDLVAKIPEAESEVRWALAYDTDPKQNERRLEAHTEEDEKADVIDRATNLLGIDDSTEPSYATTLVLDSQTEDGNGNYDAPINVSMMYNVPSNQITDSYFQRAAPVGDYQGEMPGTQFATVSYSSDTMYHQSNAPSEFGCNPAVQSTFAGYSTTSSPSQGYLSTSSGPQSQTYGPADMPLSSYQAPALKAEVVLALILHNAWNATTYKCAAYEQSCGAVFSDMQQMIAHLHQHHPDYDLALPTPVRAACCHCFTLYPADQDRLGCLNTVCPSFQGTRASSFQFTLCGTLKSFPSQSSSSDMSNEGGDLIGWCDDTEMNGIEDGIFDDYAHHYCNLGLIPCLSLPETAARLVDGRYLEDLV